LLGALTAAQIVGSLALSALAGRSQDRRPWMVVSLAASMVGFAGVALLPAAAPWLWTIVLGLGLGPLFPLALMLPIDHGRDPAAVRRLTVMVSSVAYPLAALGPFLIGWLRGVTDSYTVPFVTLAMLVTALLPVVRWFRPAHGAYSSVRAV
jgi:CP family cyanate transporter-like MFS transporter